MKILVTGGAGFIGYHTCLELCKQGHEVIIFDNLSSGNPKNVDDILAKFPNQAVFFYGDVLKLSEWNFSVDAILHLVAKTSIAESLKNPCLTSNINITGFISVCEFAKRQNIPRVIYASSAAVYGQAGVPGTSSDVFFGGICEEYYTSENPISPYGLDKFHNEKYARIFAHFSGIKFTGLRYFNVYGPHQNPDYAGVITKFILAIKENKPLIVYGNGEQERNFIHVEDVAKINVDILTNEHRVFILNIGNSDGQYTVLGLIQLLEDILKKKLTIDYQPPRDGEIFVSYPSLEMLKYHYPHHFSMIDMKSGLRNLIEK